MWSSTWTGNGWLAADGMSISYKLPLMYDELPAISYSSDFALQYNEYISFTDLSVFNYNLEQICFNVDMSYLNKLPEGEYYVSVDIVEQGNFIEEESAFEKKGYECVFKLVVS